MRPSICEREFYASPRYNYSSIWSQNMSITLRRQLNDDEKERLSGCTARDFATGLAIPEDDEVQFDHINAFAEGGETDLNNIGRCRLRPIERRERSL